MTKRKAQQQALSLATFVIALGIVLYLVAHLFTAPVGGQFLFILGFIGLADGVYLFVWQRTQRAIKVRYYAQALKLSPQQLADMGDTQAAQSAWRDINAKLLPQLEQMAQKKKVAPFQWEQS
ncbi:hypothetical protein IV38_GL000465 [Lactobacillus selangorensis]|uniref:Uncharacterized protein n=1 Tax=Lactobacillus selangorensis TaxID=81857 RepID=A0A0R2FPI9_9LACO|nr:hypothetical protein [Lactobacillus selangorensis]KRN29579.1 hypothetical protein IV38_GL000465 [Lactobacillus selangorensis]KRN33891.1 hypothetical protein IV40_GL000203 [Lactobacillus selangorensis]